MALGRQRVGRDRQTGAASLDAVVARLATPPRTWSLIVTIFGDVAAPRGGSLWLGTIQDILVPLGVDEGGVRTALSRLVADGWVERTRIGRNSYFSLTPAAAGESRAAAARIYGPREDAHDGWTLAVMADAAFAERTRQSGSAGAAGRVGSALVWPGRGRRPLSEDLDVVWLDIASQGQASDQALARSAWPLALLGEQYSRFIEVFTAFETTSNDTGDGRSATAFRVLVVHELRRIALREPGLAAGALGPDWSGIAARDLARRIWLRCLPASERWLDATGRAAGGPLPRPEPPFGWHRGVPRDCD
jgi:phenylacetic acid degradation operon negative regulatory protein